MSVSSAQAGAPRKSSRPAYRISYGSFEARVVAGALDLLVEWRGARYAIEVKLRRDTETEERALEQVTRYLDTAGLDEGWLVMFDLRSTLPWEQRLSTRTVEANGKRVFVVGC